MKQAQYLSVLMLFMGFLSAAVYAEPSSFGNASNTSPSVPADFSSDISMELASRRIWRGIDVNGSGEPAIFLQATGLFDPLRLYADLSASFSLWNRVEPYRTELSDQIVWRLYSDREFLDRYLNLAFGFSLYQNIGRDVYAYGALVPEIFWRVGCPAIILQPALEVYLDFTPNQSGTYWVIDLSQSFMIKTQSIDFEFRYGHANGFFKQGNYEFFKNIFTNPLYAMQDIIPTDLALQVSSQFGLGSGFFITPTFLVSLAVDRYLTRDIFNLTLLLRLSWLHESKHSFRDLH